MKSLVVFNKNTNCIECDDDSKIPILCKKHFNSENKKCKKHYRRLLGSVDDSESLCPYDFYTIKKGENIYTSLIFKGDNDSSILPKLKYIGEKMNPNWVYDRNKTLDLIEDINSLMKENNEMMDCTHELGNIGTYFNTMSMSVERKFPEMCEDNDVKAMLSLYEMMNYRLTLMNDLLDIGYQRKTIKLHPLLEKLRIMMSYKARNKNINIQLSSSNDYIEGFDYLYLAFFILLDNSIKYSPENRNVNVYFNQKDSNTITVIVENSGPKVENSEKDKIIMRGYRGIHSSSYIGNGIGLSIFNEICNKSDINYYILTDNRVNDEEYLFSVHVDLKRIDLGEE